MWNLKRNDTNELTYKTERLRKQTSGCSMRGGIVRDFGTLMYTLRYLKRITSKNLLCSTWTSAQRYVPAWMGGRWERMDTCVWTAESLCQSPETITTLSTGYTPVQNKTLKVWGVGNACIKVHLKK